MSYDAVYEDARAAAIELLGFVGFDTPQTRRMVEETVLEGTKEPFVPSPFKVWRGHIGARIAYILPSDLGRSRK
jgi:hypothetical protein